MHSYPCHVSVSKRKTEVVNPPTPFCNKGEEEEEDRVEENIQEKNCISHVETTKNKHINNWTAMAVLL